MKRALLTGGAGFIGVHLARVLLEADYRLVLVDDFSRGARDAALESLLADSRVALESRDLTAAAPLAGLGADFSHVVHLAGIVGVANVLRSGHRVLADNVRMSMAALDFARSQRQLERFAFASTSEVYAGTLTAYGLDFPTPEDTPLCLPPLTSPRTSYMLSKLYGEALCHQSALPFTIFRPHNVYGPRMGMSHVIPELLQRACNTPEDGALEVYSPAHRRTFCHVSDAVQWMRLAVEAPAGVGQTLNLGVDGPEVRMDRLAQCVVQTVGRTLRVVPGATTEGSPERRSPDVSRLRAVTGRAPEMTLEQGLADTYRWYREHVFDRAEPGS